MPESVTFYFDPMCPYAYQSSMWIREVRAIVDLDVTWRFFSLEEVNLVDGKPTRGSGRGRMASARCGSVP